MVGVVGWGAETAVNAKTMPQCPKLLMNTKTMAIIGDISGKGLAAALYMVRVQAIIHSLINQFDNIKDIIINLKTSVRLVSRKDED